MNREPVGLYIFRILLGLGLFIFMAMLYWSSSLIETDVKELKGEVQQLKSELINIRSDLNPGRPDFAPAGAPAANASKAVNRPHIDPSLPNLMTEDPFYATTLPKLLGPDFKPKGTFSNAVVGRPDNLHPFSPWGMVIAWHRLCSAAVSRLAFGIYETFTPDMAIKVEERTDPKGVKEYWVHLRENLFWQPLKQSWFTENINLAPVFFKKHPVTAEDFKFYWDAIMNPFVQEGGAISARTYLSEIEEIRVIDPLTFAVRWKGHEVKRPDGTTAFETKYMAKQLTGSLQPLASFVYKYYADGKKIVEDDSDPNTYNKNSVWAQQFSQHWAKNIIVSCGPWMFNGMTDRQIKFERNPGYFFPLDALVEASEYTFKESTDTMWEDFKINKLDAYILQPDHLHELENFLASDLYKKQEKEGAAIKKLHYVARTYSFIGWNEANPLFSNKKVRQALTMAIDRQRIIRQILNGRGIEINGTFYRYSPAYDASIPFWPYDPDQARRLLEEEGWFDSTGTGVIDKMIDGKRTPFTFKITYFVKNAVGKSISEYVATSLKALGITAELNGVDIADLSAKFDGKVFDAILLTWGLGTPPDDPRQLWHSAGAKEPGSSNFIGFANTEADAIIDALDYESDPEKRTALYHRFDAIIHDEAPYIFLYTPKTTLVYRERLQNVFIPAERQDLIPGANIAEPDSNIFFLKNMSGA